MGKESLREQNSRSLGRAIEAFLSDESGQATVEYILLLSGTVVGAALVGKAILRGMENAILSMAGQLQKDLKTGRMNLGIWSR